MKAMDALLFVGFPYAAIALFVLGTLVRYRRMAFQVSTLSSQFLESNSLFWGSVPFHLGVLAVLTGHLLAFLLPDAVLLWNAVPVRLLALEFTGLALAFCMLWGLLVLLTRRLTRARLQVVTTPMDLAVELLLVLQVVLGIWTAVAHRWGSSWFAADLTPYLWSLALARPDASVVAAMPLAVKLHVVGAFLLLALVPFSRLVHFVVAPFHYLWRPYQLVIWNWDRKRLRDPATPWSPTRPRNN